MEGRLLYINSRRRSRGKLNIASARQHHALITIIHSKQVKKTYFLNSHAITIQVFVVFHYQSVIVCVVASDLIWYIVSATAPNYATLFTFILSIIFVTYLLNSTISGVHAFSGLIRRACTLPYSFGFQVS